MRRLLLVLLAVAGLGLLGRGAVPCGAFSVQPRCYVALHPGPSQDTLHQLQVSGARTYPSAGEFLLTTVEVDSSLDTLEWFTTAFSSRIDQVPRDVLFPPGADEDVVRQHNIAAMDESQLTATAAALRAVGFDVDLDPDGAEVLEVTEGLPAEDRLQPGDVIRAVDGEPTVDAEAVVAAVQERQVGDEVTFTLSRDGRTLDVALPLAESPDDPATPLVGALLSDHVVLPIDVAIDAGEIGGPSAGLMFALAIVDTLEPEDLTGGAVVAGTGTIDLDGRIGAIGGIQQKILGALDRDGEPASVFLVPEGNLPEARDTPVDRDVLIIPVATLEDALHKLGEVRAGREPGGAVALGG